MKRTKLVFAIAFLISTFFMSVGYAAISSIALDIEGTASATVQSGVFITDVTYKSNVGADTVNSMINNFIGSIMNSTVVLGTSNNSSITYEVEVYNNTNDDYAFKSTTFDQNFYDNDGIKFELNGISKNTIVPSKQSKKFTITFSYENGANVSNTLNSYLNFSFGKNHTITYMDIEGTYQTNIANGLKYENEFSPAPDDIEVSMGGNTLTKGTDFTYENGVLTISNVTDNLVITGITNLPQETILADNSNLNYGDLTDYSVDGITGNWRIFYNDGTNIFLIKETCVNVSELDETTKNALAITTSNNNSVTWSTTKLPNDGVYTLDETKASKWGYSTMLDVTNKSYAYRAITKSVDVTNCNIFVNTDLADEAIAAPTIEMWVKSWNKVYPEYKLDTELSAGKTGYAISVNGGTASTTCKLTSTQGWSDKNPLYFDTTADRYWFASSASSNAQLLHMNMTSGTIIGGSATSYKAGLRPVVCLNKDVKGVYDEETKMWHLSK